MKKNIIILSSVIAIIAVLSCVFYVIAADPATESDPLITKSYVEQVVLPDIYNYIDMKTQQSSSDSNSSGFDSFKVVAVSPGKKVICDAGTELILRMGQATIIGSARGGLADVTAGADLASGAAVPSNHHLIVPLSDSRGIAINTPDDALVMIKGSYKIQ